MEKNQENKIGFDEEAKANAEGRTPGSEADAKGSPPGSEADDEGRPPGSEADGEGRPPGSEADAKGSLPGSQADGERRPPGSDADTVGRLPGSEADTVGRPAGSEADAVGRPPGSEADAVGRPPGLEVKRSSISDFEKSAPAVVADDWVPTEEEGTKEEENVSEIWEEKLPLQEDHIIPSLKDAQEEDTLYEPLVAETLDMETQKDFIQKTLDKHVPQVEKQTDAELKDTAASAAGTGQKSAKQSARILNEIQPAEVQYKAAARVIQDHTIPLSQRSCGNDFLGASVRGAKAGSNRQIAELMRHDIREYQRAYTRAWEPNPACTVPMRVRRYGHKSRVKATPRVEEWRIWEERDKERRDHELAELLGYETLVGNLLYIDIPGGKDINRSWQNFLSEDVMEWGFPYEKGSIERLRMKQPEPYLAHQVKEKLWKFPRSRTFQTTQEE